MENQNNTPENVIPLAEAQNWVQGWRNNCGGLNLNAFLIPSIDFKQILDNHPDIQDVRGYLGYDGQEFKLMIVGVDANGNDLIDLPGHNIYDFTKPCPTTCDSKSPLITLKSV